MRPAAARPAGDPVRVVMARVWWSSVLGAALAAAAVVSAAAQVMPGPSFRVTPPSPPDFSQRSPADAMRFAAEALESGVAKLRFAELAVERAQAPAVREFARRMIAEHRPANIELQAIARSRGHDLSTELSAGHRLALAALRGRADADFDAAYMAVMVRDHAQAVTLYEAAAAADFLDPDLKAVVEKMLPIVREHLAAAQRIRPDTAAASASAASPALQAARSPVDASTSCGTSLGSRPSRRDSSPAANAA
jgi:putative membrane protein